MIVFFILIFHFAQFLVGFLDLGFQAFLMTLQTLGQRLVAEGYHLASE